MILGFVGDEHIGARGGNDDVRNFIGSYLKYYLFPKFKELGVQAYIQSGDMFDVRKAIHGLDMQLLLDVIIPLHEEYQIEGHALTGNHDATLRDSNRVSWVNVAARLSGGYIVSYQETCTVTIGDTKFCMIPWINKENYERTLKAIDASDAKYAVGHLELAGFPMYKNSIADEGQVELTTLAKFEKVLSGHFHTQSESGNITYIGTPYHLTWQDFPDGTNRGFWTLDTETGVFTFHPNPEHLTLFKVFVYDWNRCEIDTEYKLKLKEPKYLEEDYGLKGSIVKVVVESRGNAKHYEEFCSALRRCSLIDYTIVDKTETVSRTASEGGETDSEVGAAVISEETLQTDVLQTLKERITLTEGIDVKLAVDIITDVHSRAVNSGETL